MKIQRNHIAIGIAVCLVVWIPLGATVVRQSRVHQFKSIESEISQRGGSLSWELVDGDYSVQLLGAAAVNGTVKTISVILRDLPTGFTLLGPGESRLFHVVLDSSQVRNDGFASLLELPVEFLLLDGGTITDQTAERLAHHRSLKWLQLVDVSVSEDALGLIRKENPGLNVTTEAKAKYQKDVRRAAVGRRLVWKFTRRCRVIFVVRIQRSRRVSTIKTNEDQPHV